MVFKPREGFYHFHIPLPVKPSKHYSLGIRFIGDSILTPADAESMIAGENLGGFPALGSSVKTLGPPNCSWLSLVCNSVSTTDREVPIQACIHHCQAARTEWHSLIWSGLELRSSLPQHSSLWLHQLCCPPGHSLLLSGLTDLCGPKLKMRGSSFEVDVYLCS